MKKVIFLIVLIIIAGGITAQTVVPPVIPDRQFDIISFGAKTSLPDNTKEIQASIDACNKAGGGRVIIPAGTFLCGPITMKSNVELYLSQDAVLRALPYGEGNGVPAGSYPNNGTADNYSHLIYAKRCSMMRIAGPGTIEGDGSAWWKAYRETRKIKRGCLIRFDDCKNFEIQGISLRNAPNVHFTAGRGSSGYILRDLTIEAPEDAPNSDGIDTWAANGLIENCTISCGDDNIAMDTGTKNLTIRRCHFGRGHGCSIGSHTSGIENILVDSCTFTGTESAIRMKSNRTRGGGERNITYSNIVMDGVKNPIYITSYYPKTPKNPEDDAAVDVSQTTPLWENVVLRNVSIKNSDRAGIIWGVPEQPICNLILDNVVIEARKGFILNYAKNVRFINGSSVRTPDNAVSVYEADYSGVDSRNGKPMKP